ncbi:MAG: lipoate--protein ligase family protein [Candidatus Omnitrophica bacterium]|nr:lipoate--protein ligase family protein [Candidatus Omnitrophota bacterium]
MMQIKDISFDTAQENILFDELLLQLAEKQSTGEVLRFWESQTVFIVLGRIGKEQDDIWLDQARQDNIPVFRRTSGGGTVVQGPGCLNFTFVLNKERHADLGDLRKSYAWISAKVIDALQTCGVKAVFRPISDIALTHNQKKISGNAQHRGKHFILHHGTILYDFDLNLISRYLKIPQEIPAYRQSRSQADFVTNIHIQARPFKQALAGIFGLHLSQEPPQPSSQELLALADLLQKRSVVVDF